MAEFLDSIGYDAYDVGPLAEGWRYQRDTAAYAGIYVRPGDDWPGPGRPAAWVNVVGLGVMVFNLLDVNMVSTGLHSYGGVS